MLEFKFPRVDNKHDGTHSNPMTPYFYVSQVGTVQYAAVYD